MLTLKILWRTYRRPDSQYFRSNDYIYDSLASNLPSDDKMISISIQRTYKITRTNTTAAGLDICEQNK